MRTLRRLSPLAALLVLTGLVTTPARAQVFEFYPYDEENVESLDTVNRAAGAVS